MQLLSNGWASPLDMEWMIEQGDWDGDCANWVAWHDPAPEDSPIFNAENGTGLKPSDMLLLSLGGCSAVDVVSILAKQRQELTGLEMRVNALHPGR